MMKSHRWSPAILTLLLLCTPALSHAAILDATRVTLKNGLRILLAPDSLATTVDVALWFPSGPRHEQPAQAGMALLAARLGFRNGASEPLAPLQAEAGVGSMLATPDLTSFSATVPAEALGAALDFLAARLRGTPNSSAEFAAERAAIRAERTRPDRTPVVRALARLWAAAWPGHPYSQTGAVPGAGSEQLTPATLQAWRNRRYTPAAAVLTVTGAFVADSALAAIRSRFERIAGGAVPVVPPLAAPRAAGRATERFESPVRLCLIGWRGPGAGDPDAPALELLAAWLGGGVQAQLARSLVRDWHLASATQAGFIALKEGSLLWALAAIPATTDSVVLERTLLDAASSVMTSAPTVFELERARRQVEATTYFALQTTRQRGQALGEAELLAGDGAVAQRRLEALRRVTPEDLRRVAARVMTRAGQATVWMIPAESGGVR
jgi:zinc protease